ncbi:MerR family transcriptional regulator [Sphaerisporangium corydalis]|uniref:MerR family transcriptional regulator n=1 Tax=Sphaerisporangium corydalis TaxID=1441875 RepID=A0ABV9EV96_9ACTN|nr:MerR family transcriptional regulator [Sphaerisporangium corydalis]
MNDDGLYTIGQVARLAKLSVPTVRYYSDEGLVPPAGRSAGGYRLYDHDALDRLELVRTLRDLGVDIATIAQVLADPQTLIGVADGQIAALEEQIRTLRVRQAVLRYVTTGRTGSPGMARANRLARLPAERRRQLAADLVAEATRGLDMEPQFAAQLRSMLPDLPEDPSAEQFDAWLELAHQVGDPSFRESMRQAFERHATDRSSGAEQGDPESWAQAEQAVLDLAGGALADGIPPGSAAARPIVERLVTVFARAHRRSDDPRFRVWLAERIRIGADPRISRYWRLLAMINGTSPKPDPVPEARWFLAALERAAAKERGGAGAPG